MNTAVQAVRMYRGGQKLVACALEEPSITLIENDEVFGMLAAAGAHEDSFSGRLFLDSVWYLRVEGTSYWWTHYDTVVISREGEICAAQDIVSGCYLPKPSRAAYQTDFISPAEYAVVRNSQAEGIAQPVFHLARRHFGDLPGFKIGRQRTQRARRPGTISRIWRDLKSAGTALFHRRVPPVGSCVQRIG